MAQPWIDKHKVAQVLTEAVYESDSVVAHRYGLSPRTVRGYRMRLAEDNELEQIFQQKVRVYEADWGSKLALVQIEGYKAMEKLCETVVTIAEKVEQAQPDSEMIKAMSGLIDSLSNMLSENAQVGLTRDVVHAKIRNAGTYQQNGKETNKVATKGYVITDKSELFD